MTTDALPTSTGEETLEDRIKKLEGKSEGLLQEVKHERDLRHQAEERLKLVESSLETAGADEEKPEVIEARNFVRGEVEEVIKPLKNTVNFLVSDRKVEQALDHLSEQAGMTKSKFRKEHEAALEKIVKERNLNAVGIDPYVGILNAWEIHQNSVREAEKAEKERTERISGSQPETSRTAPASSGNLPKRINASRLANLSDKEFDEVNQAIKEGRIEVIQDEDRYKNPNAV